MASSARLTTLVPIRNMNRALGFYTKKLGAKLKVRGQGEMKDGWAWIQVAGSDVWLIAPEKREKRTLAYSTFLVKDIKGYVAGLLRKGVKFDKPARMSKESKIEGPIAFEPWGASAFFKDTEGNLYMVYQDSAAM